ncbi:ParB/RepB/Spo0J family partition protein [Butyrivibrio sp.]|uniref:ParB/RepB/Spo0J family partition protein n=1 Tax=Butyrivibrio sp. TaxID=28121 RepID=UPI0025B8F236|nr:ParB/RepB/Spo0J family partition protein [Butyrivibrio sp.]MBQ9305462.1 ParB-like nuclease domain-containing protein [Butyrivibrio sp.]
MASSNSFDQFISDEIEKGKGLYVPVKASRFERMFVKWHDCKDLHPNPDDEFSDPAIGPSYRIISDYEREFRDRLKKGEQPINDPLIVGKVHPEGYMLINGHHRWAAALKVEIKKVPIKIINMMSDEELQRIVESSQHDKRVTMDLDEVVFKSKWDNYVEKETGFHFGSKIKKKMMLGIPALFNYLTTHGYDIFVYSSEFYSIDDIRRYFNRFFVHVDGIITGTGKKNVKFSESQKTVMNLIKNKYAKTIHIDNDSVICTHSGTGEFEEYDLEVPGSLWSKKVIEIIEKIDAPPAE